VPARTLEGDAGPRRGERHHLRVQGRRLDRRLGPLGHVDPQVGDDAGLHGQRRVCLAAHPDRRLDPQRVHDGPLDPAAPLGALHWWPGYGQDEHRAPVPRAPGQECLHGQEDVLLVRDHAHHLPAPNRELGREALGQEFWAAGQQEDARLHRRHLDARVQRLGRPDHDGDCAPTHGVQGHVQPRQAGRVQEHPRPDLHRRNAPAGWRQERHLVHGRHERRPVQAPVPRDERDAPLGRLDQPDLRRAAARAVPSRQREQGAGRVGRVGDARGHDHLRLGGCQEEDAPHARQVPLHLQPARPVSNLPRRLHVRLGCGQVCQVWLHAQNGHHAARALEARVRARLRRPAGRLGRQGLVRQDDQQAARGPVRTVQGGRTQGLDVLRRLPARRRRGPRDGRGARAAADLRACRQLGLVPRARQDVLRPIQRPLQAERGRHGALRRRPDALHAHLPHHAHAARLGAARGRGRFGQANPHAPRSIRGRLHLLPVHHHEAVQLAKPDGRLQAALYAGGHQEQGSGLHLHRQGDQRGGLPRVHQHLPQYGRVAQPLRARRARWHLRRGVRRVRKVAPGQARGGPLAGRPLCVLHQPRARQLAHRALLLTRRPEVAAAHPKVPRPHQRLHRRLVPPVARGGPHGGRAPLYGQVQYPG